VRQVRLPEAVAGPLQPVAAVRVHTGAEARSTWLDVSMYEADVVESLQGRQTLHRRAEDRSRAQATGQHRAALANRRQVATQKLHADVGKVLRPSSLVISGALCMPLQEELARALREARHTAHLKAVENLHLATRSLDVGLGLQRNVHVSLQVGSAVHLAEAGDQVNFLYVSAFFAEYIYQKTMSISKCQML